MEFHTHRFRVSKTTTSSLGATSVKRYADAQTRAQTCSRCRRLKKRCSRTPPECELCLHGGHVCSLQQLTITPIARSSDPDSTQNSGVVSVTSSPQIDQTDAELSCHQHVESQAQNEVTASTFDGTYQSYLHAYFRHVHRAYPFLDKKEILSNAKASMYENVWADDPDSIILGLVLAIGGTTLERAGKLSAYDRSSMIVPYARILTRCLLSPSLKGLQILTLLSLYSLFDPEGISTWSIVGILTRQATALGLSRQDASLQALNPHQEEMRHRLFWSIFALDRMLAVSVGHPAGFVDENMNIPQPAVTVEEFASCERAEHASLLQLNRHIIQLRQLEQQILVSVHTRNQMDISNMTSADRATTSRQLRSAVDDWYSLGCLVCLPEADNIPIHSTITWLNARYYNLLILLYYPCHFNSQARHSSAGELIRYTRKYLKYNHILLENKQLPLNYITLNRLIPACLVFMHCFVGIQSSTFEAKSELSNCINILRSFPKDWTLAHQTANVVGEFLSVIASHDTFAASQIIDYTKSNDVPMTPTIRADLGKLISRLSQIAAKALSPASCYLALCDWEKSSSVSAPLPTSSDTGIDNTTEQMTAWSLTNDYDFGFL